MNPTELQLPISRYLAGLVENEFGEEVTFPTPVRSCQSSVNYKVAESLMKDPHETSYYYKVGDGNIGHSELKGTYTDFLLFRVIGVIVQHLGAFWTNYEI